MYTKDPCPLCDELVEELMQFEGRFHLEKVDITEKENLRYLRLYRMDIPVVFFNGEFLCMHRINIEKFKNRLEEIEKLIF